MKAQLLFIQGGGAGAYKEDRKLAVSLQAALATDYRVLHPKMPKEAAPEYKLWKAEIARQLGKIRGARLLVGHSVGAAMLLKYLSEVEVNGLVAGLFLLAAPFIGADEQWRDDAVQVDFRRFRTFPQTFLYHCRDDEIVPFAHLALYRDKLPRAVVRSFPSGGHQFKNRVPEIAADIKRVKRANDQTREI
jgi:uncharacterized protein